MRVLIVSHDASLTGAPVVLLSFVRWIEAQAIPDVRLDVLLLRGGPLVPAFEDLAPVRVLQAATSATPSEVAYRHLTRGAPNGAWRMAAQLRTAVALRAVEHHDVAWLNSVASAPVLRGLGRRRSPRVVTAVHERDRAFDALAPPDWTRLVRRTDRFVAGADVIAECLRRRPGVDPGRIEPAPVFVDPEREPDGSRRPTVPDGAAVRRRWGLPVDAFVVGAVGAASWRKGADLFVRLAEDLRRRAAFDRTPPVHLVWVGGDGEQRQLLETEVTMAGLAGSVTAVAPRSALSEVMAALDLLALTSREDALPLVLLEAGLAALPVVHFDHLGLGSLVAPPAGVGVPFGDTAAMADVIERWRGDREARRRAGGALRDRVRRDHLVDVGAPRWWAAVERVVHQSRRR